MRFEGFDDDLNPIRTWTIATYVVALHRIALQVPLSFLLDDPIKPSDDDDEEKVLSFTLSTNRTATATLG